MSHGICWESRPLGQVESSLELADSQTIPSTPFISADRAVTVPALCNIPRQDYLLGNLRTPRPSSEGQPDPDRHGLDGPADAETKRQGWFYKRIQPGPARWSNTEPAPSIQCFWY